MSVVYVVQQTPSGELFAHAWLGAVEYVWCRCIRAIRAVHVRAVQEDNGTVQGNDSVQHLQNEESGDRQAHRPKTQKDRGEYNDLVARIAELEKSLKKAGAELVAFNGDKLLDITQPEQTAERAMKALAEHEILAAARRAEIGKHEAKLAQLRALLSAPAVDAAAIKPALKEPSWTRAEREMASPTGSFAGTI